MSEYIEREKDKFIKLSQALEVLDSCSCWWVHDRMELIPAADVRPVVRGKWIEDWETGCSECSVCHESFLWEDFKGVADWKYCPNCGAKMEES